MISQSREAKGRRRICARKRLDATLREIRRRTREFFNRLFGSV
jgi:hypothetical protein